MTDNTTVLITGASGGIGAVYADRFARRGHNLVLVARNTSRLEALAQRLESEYGVTAETIAADLSLPGDQQAVVRRLRDDARIGVLVNNAGTGLSGSFISQAEADIQRMVAVNLSAALTLAHAIAPRLAAAGQGAIINLGSVVGLAPEFGLTVYGATKAFILFLSQGLSLELGPQGVYVQAVLPAATRTELWEKSGIDVNTVPGVMDVEEMVDAALVGYDRREDVTIPSLHDEQRWSVYQQARRAIIPGSTQAHCAPRYRSADQ